MTAARGNSEGTGPEFFPGRNYAGGGAVNRVATVIVVLAIVALMARRWVLTGPYPPGLDGAQWLALGRGLHGIGRSTDGAYAPLVPLLATIGEGVFGPLAAVRLLAVGSGLAVALASWLLASEALGPVWGLVAAGIAIPASALAEPSLYGGYPQQFALAAGIVALWATGRYITTGRRWLLWLVGSSAGMAALAHHIYFPLLLLSVLLAVLIWSTFLGEKARPGPTPPLMLALAPACGIFAVVAYRFVVAGYRAPLTASEQATWDAWQYATREAPKVWLALLAIAIVSLALLWRSRAAVAWVSSVSLIVPAGSIFLLSGQPRLLPPVLIGIAIAVGLGGGSLATWLDRRSRRSGSQKRGGDVAPDAAGLAERSFFGHMPWLIGAGIALWLAMAADRATTGFAEFYRVVDQPLVAAAAAIDRDEGSGAVAVREDRRGWPIGWWFEALLEQPVIVGSDPRWLGFPEEQERAWQAEELFDGGLDAATFAERAADAGVEYLVMPKWDWIGWDRWLNQPGFPVTVLYDDDRYLVLRVEH